MDIHLSYNRPQNFCLFCLEANLSMPYAAIHQQLLSESLGFDMFLKLAESVIVVCHPRKDQAEKLHAEAGYL